MTRRNILKDPIPQFGSYRCPEFGIEGDFRAAYEWLKEQFTVKVESNSGPIKPLTEQEKLIEQNPATAKMLETLPTEEYL